MNRLIGLVAVAFFAVTGVVVHAQPPSGGFYGETAGWVPGPPAYYNPRTADKYSTESGGYQKTSWQRTDYVPSTHYHKNTYCGPCGPVTNWVPHTTYNPVTTTHNNSSNWRVYSGYENSPGRNRTYSGHDNSGFQETIVDRYGR